MLFRIFWIIQSSMFYPSTIAITKSKCCSNSSLYEIIALLWSLEHMPGALWHTFESLLETLRIVLLLDAQCCNVRDLADKNKSDPAVIFLVSEMRRLVLL